MILSAACVGAGPWLAVTGWSFGPEKKFPIAIIRVVEQFQIAKKIGFENFTF